MAKKIDDGGPAFPRPMSFQPEGAWCQDHGEPGLSLCDWFAGQALTNLPALLAEDGRDGEGFEQYVASRAYRLAEAMLAERNKGRG